jgi:membrane-associated phospholipid phosphatase
LPSVYQVPAPRPPGGDGSSPADAAWARGERRSADDDLSFFSGHTSGTFAAAGAFGTIARLRGDRGWIAVYAVGFAAAATVGYLRMAADAHWLTDVAAGAAVGAAAGVGVPLLLHRAGSRASASASATAGPASFAITIAF